MYLSLALIPKTHIEILPVQHNSRKNTFFPCAAAKSLQSCPTLCDPIDSSPQAPLSLGFSRQEHWRGLPFPSPMHERKSESEVAQLCPTLSSSMDCSPPGSSVHGIFQARRMESGAIVFFHRVFFLQLEFDFHSQYSPLKRSTEILPANHVTSTRREPIPHSYTLLLPLLL